MISRRLFAAGAASMAAGLAVPAVARERPGREPPKRNRQQRGQPSISAAFSHGVASGEPGATSMTFWTRHYDGGGSAAPLRLELSTDPQMARSRIAAEALADPERDHTARATVSDLAPDTLYYYRWLGPQNTQSPPGRTRTLPGAAARQFRIGVFSCASTAGGWFNGYAHAAAADDIDLALHLGDYLCLPPSPATSTAIAGRPPIQPANPQSRADHWAHYRALRTDPDLLALHAHQPFIALFDDHRLGAGLPAAVAQAAQDAWRDWLPVGDDPYARYEIGRLATLFRLDTVLSGRDPPLDVSLAAGATDPLAALARLRDDAWVDGARQVLGRDQERWLLGAMAADASRGVRRQMLAQQTMMANLMMPADVVRLAGDTAPPGLRIAALLAQAGLPMQMAGWGGYPAARARLLAAARRYGVDLISLAAGNHNGWASDLPSDGQPAGVEFAVQSISAPGLEAVLPASAADAMVRANPALRFANLSQRGYMHLLLTPAQTLCEWRFTQPVASRSSQLAATITARTATLERKIVMG